MRNIYLYLLLITTTLILVFFSKYLLDSEKILIDFLSESYSVNQIENYLNIQKKWLWLSYFFTPMLLLVKTSIISSILDVGCFFFNKNIKYKKLFSIVLKAEFIFLLAIIFKTAWFYLFKLNYTLEDIQYFYPLSAINIIGYKGLETWFIYPFQVLNLFEVAYWFVLAYLIGKEINDTTEKGLLIVASSYGVGLLIWVVGVIFLTLNMS